MLKLGVHDSKSLYCWWVCDFTDTEKEDEGVKYLIYI